MPPQVAASGSVRILGLDPGSQATGFGIIDWIGGAPRYVASGTIRTSGEEFPPRLRQIFDGVQSSLMREYRPTEVAVERVFMHRNADSALKLGQARGAALCAAFGSDPGGVRVRAARGQAGGRRSGWGARRSRSS